MMDVALNILSGKKKIFLYAFYIVGVTMVFIFIRFPGEAVRDFVENNVQRLHPDVSLAVDAAGLSPLFKIRLKNCTLYYQGTPAVQARTLDVRPSLLSLLGIPACSFKARLFDGVMQGHFKRDKDGTVHLDTRFKDLKAEKMGLERYFTRYLPSGTCRGDAAVDIEANNIRGKLAVVLENGEMTFQSPVFGLNGLDLGTMDVVMAMDGKKVTIERFDVNGPQVTGSFTGDIRLQIPYANSAVTINGFITPQSSLIAKLGEAFPMEMLLAKTPGKNGFPVTVAGTLAQPAYSMN
jgi:type II secretion system protein N